MAEEKPRFIQEFVPGKQVTIAHIIANPDPAIYQKVGLRWDATDEANRGRGSIGVLTLTPSECSILAADVATKASGIEIGFVDRFTGSLLIMGRLSDVETAVRDVMSFLVDVIGCSPAEITRT
ncbi:MAG: BMC domain-containing protein [Propionibacteriaceae bacterium]|jgi:ethanolamine utilization protein EutS|nr:BMC domain-containing protein [Propionibacteriaceae bacterium]